MSKRIILKLFKIADIKINVDLTIKDESFYDDLLNYKTLGLGEAYMNDKFDTNNLEKLLTKLSKLNDINLLYHLNFYDIFYFLKYFIWKFFIVFNNYIFNNQTIIKSLRVGKQHYDLPPILYDRILGTTKLYSCAYWNDAESLDEAQINKINLIINKLHIKNEQNILEIGCGFGIISYTIAKRYPNTKVLGISISKEQINYCNKAYNLKNLKFELIDYRNLKHDSFDRIFSVGMFEHIGYKQYTNFFNITYKLLKNNGIMLTHTICKDKHNYGNDPFFEKYIFPGANLTSISQILESIEKTKYEIEDVHQFGLYYAITLENWYVNFNENFEELNQKYPNIFDEKFKRMWWMYLKMSKVGFNTKSLKLAQFIFTKNSNSVYNRYLYM